MNCLALGIENTLLKRDVNVGRHKRIIIRYAGNGDPTNWSGSKQAFDRDRLIPSQEVTDAGDLAIAPVAAGLFAEPSEESRAPARVRRLRETASVEPPKTFALLRIAALRRIYSPSLAPSASIIKLRCGNNDASLQHQQRMCSKCDVMT